MPPTQTVMIILLAGRAQPAEMAALHFRPAAIGLVCASSVQSILPGREARFRRLLPGVRLLDSSLAAPDSVTETGAAIRRALDAAPGLAPIISVTGATLPMAIGAYEVARQLGCPACYLPTNGNALLDLTRPETTQPISLDIRIDDYLAIYDQAPDPKHQPSRQNTRGDQLEARVHRAARALQLAGRPLFDECRRGLKLLSGAGREIDFFGITAGMPLIASCKTGKRSAWQKADLDELRTWGDMLGGNYCVRLYITDVPRPEPADRAHRQRYEQFVEEAATHRVVVWSAGDPRTLAELLAAEQLNPTYPRH